MKHRNPVLPLKYCFPDGEPHYINGELYVYPSCDANPGSYCSDKLYVPHSKDLSKWIIDGPVFDSSLLNWPYVISYPPGLIEAKNYKELPDYFKQYLSKITYIIPFSLFKAIVKKVCKSSSKKASKNRLLYAPDSLTVNGKSYLFFCTSDGLEGVATSDHPEGPFTNPVMITTDKSNNPITGIDPAVFKDDDGKVYLYWGQINSQGAELSDDLCHVKEESMVNGLLTEKEHGFHEGSSMRKINGIYYYIFADYHRGKPTALGYATSSSPLGPFTYRGIIVDNNGCDDQTWNNHGSIECVDGKWYVFYHRSTNNSRYLRRMCAEPITILKDGTIPEVPVTSIGMGEPYKINETIPGYEACQVRNAYIQNDKLILKPGKSTVIYRYIDRNDIDFKTLEYEGNGSFKMDYKVSEEGELTISFECDKECEIRSFQIRK